MASGLVRGLLGCAALAVTSSASANETITYVYDAKGRLVQVVRSGSVSAGVTTTYTHDKADNRGKVTTSGSGNPAPS